MVIPSAETAMSEVELPVVMILSVADGIVSALMDIVPAELGAANTIKLASSISVRPTPSILVNLVFIDLYVSSLILISPECLHKCNSLPSLSIYGDKVTFKLFLSFIINSLPFRAFIIASPPSYNI
jgi:hypothetical protein